MSPRKRVGFVPGSNGAYHAGAPDPFRGVSEQLVKRKQDAGNTASEGHFLVLAAHIDQGVAISRAGRVRWASARFARELGRVRSDRAGRPFDGFPDSGRGWKCCRCRRADGGEANDLYRSADGEASSRDRDHPDRWDLVELRGDDSARRAVAAPRSVAAERRRSRRPSGSRPVGRWSTRSTRWPSCGAAQQRDLRASSSCSAWSVTSCETPVTVIRGYNNLLLSDHAGPSTSSSVSSSRRAIAAASG